MKKFGIIATLVLALAVTALAAGHRDIRSAEAKSLLATKKNAFLLDVRTPAEFASYLLALLQAGANFVGGCCGTSPEFIRALHQQLPSSTN